jgi:hypothetical protein
MESLVNAGIPPTITLVFPFSQVPAITGVQGTGGAILAQVPKGLIFTIGLQSPIFAFALPPTSTRFIGNTVRVDGAAPRTHFKVAPFTTYDFPIFKTSCSSSASALTATAQTIDCRLRQQTYCHEQKIAGFASKPIVMNTLEDAYTSGN